jgi:hypothetical protein
VHGAPGHDRHAGRGAPELSAEDAPFLVGFSGDTTGFADDDGSLRVAGRPAGGAPCAPTYSSDPGTTLVYSQTVAGAWTTSTTVTVAEVQSYLICAWLEDAGVTQKAASATVTVRPPNLALTLTAPTRRISPGKPLTVGATWSAEVERRLHVVLVGASSCAQSYQAVLSLTSNYNALVDRSVSGAGAESYVATLSTPGTYLACGYLEQRSDEPAQLVAQAGNTVRVAVPPKAKACGNPGGRRHITRVRGRVVTCSKARSVARHWGAAKHAPSRVLTLSCRAKRGVATCTGVDEQKVTFHYR